MASHRRSPSRRIAQRVACLRAMADLDEHELLEKALAGPVADKKEAETEEERKARRKDKKRKDRSRSRSRSRSPRSRSRDRDRDRHRSRKQERSRDRSRRVLAPRAPRLRA